MKYSVADHFRTALNQLSTQELSNQWFCLLPEEPESKSVIYVVGANIVTMRTDAIVNAANRSLQGGGGVDGAIHRAAGPELKAACAKLSRIEYGEARITPAFALPSRFIIHVAGPHYYGAPTEPQELAACYANALTLAREQHCRSIAFPGISTGIYRYPQEAAADIALRASSQWLTENHDWPMVIVICCFAESMYQAYAKWAQKHSSN